jgi:RimJ/RimL family protein N-acetyltransferase
MNRDLPSELRTDRLLLRRWTEADHEPFAALNADPLVTEFLPAILSREESDAVIQRLEAHFERHGFGFWAVETEDGSCAGFVGLSVPRFEAAFTPCVEIAWRLAPEHWGRGYATEAARAALAFGFEVVGLEEILSFTVPANVASRRVMEKIGMRCDRADDFEHPSLAEGHRLRHHVLYRALAPISSTVGYRG